MLGISSACSGSRHSAAEPRDVLNNILADLLAMLDRRKRPHLQPIHRTLAPENPHSLMSPEVIRLDLPLPSSANSTSYYRV